MTTRLSAEDVLDRIPKPPNYITFLQLKTRLGCSYSKLSNHLAKLERSGKILRTNKHGTGGGSAFNFDTIQKISESTD